MLTSPPVRVSLRRFGAWRVAAVVLAGLGVAAQLAWAAAHQAVQRPALLAVGVLVGGLLLCLVAAVMHNDPVDLRWDGLSWHLGPIGADGVEGRIAVAIDLGFWMLLRFTPVAPAAGWRRRALWLPTQRRGLEAAWHALRCAVHAPRAFPATTAARGP